MRQRCPLEIVDGHLIVLLDGRRVLLDTGSPHSLGDGRPFTLLGLTHDPPTASDGLDVAGIARSLGTELHGVLGCDLLLGSLLLLDLANGFVLFSVVPLVLGEASEPLDLARGVPVATITFDGAPAAAVIDTAARRSYMDPELAASREQAGIVREVHPRIGAFDTAVYRLRVELGETPFEGDFGVLPETQRARMPGPDVRWILGCDLLREGPVLLDLQAGSISFAGD